MKMQKEKIISNIFKHVNEKKWKCLIEGCPCIAINSHLLQRNGILNILCDDDHLYEYRVDSPFKWTKNKLPFKITRVGIHQEALSQYLFCPTHDNQLFKPIETYPIDMFDYTNQLLFCYRATCGEFRRNEKVKELYKRFFDAQSLNFPTSEIQILIDGTIQGLSDLQYYQNEFLNEFQDPQKRFHFNSFELPFYSIYASASFNSPPVSRSPIKPLNAVFINLIPKKTSLQIIIGYHTAHKDSWIDDFISSWQNASDEILEQKLSLLFTKVESCGMSGSVYRNLTASHLSKLDRLLRKEMEMISIDEDNTNLNLFR